MYKSTCLSLLADVVLKEGLRLSALAIVLDDCTRALDDLLGLTLAVELAEADPLAELLAIGHLDDGDRVLLGKGLNETDVLRRVAVLSENAEVRLLEPNIQYSNASSASQHIEEGRIYQHHATGRV
jgi:hypothetical protein